MWRIFLAKFRTWACRSIAIVANFQARDYGLEPVELVPFQFEVKGSGSCFSTYFFSIFASFLLIKYGIARNP